MKHRLFDVETDAWNDDARQFSTEIERAVEPLIEKWHDSGFSIRDIEIAATQSVSFLCSFYALKGARK